MKKLVLILLLLTSFKSYGQFNVDFTPEEELFTGMHTIANLCFIGANIHALTSPDSANSKIAATGFLISGLLQTTVGLVLLKNHDNETEKSLAIANLVAGIPTVITSTMRYFHRSKEQEHTVSLMPTGLYQKDKAYIGLVMHINLR